MLSLLPFICKLWRLALWNPTPGGAFGSLGSSSFCPKSGSVDLLQTDDPSF